jgi:hypothetical protein
MPLPWLTGTGGGHAPVDHSSGESRYRPLRLATALMLLRNATTSQVLSGGGSMDSVQSSELVNAIALPVSLNELINLRFR